MCVVAAHGGIVVQASLLQHVKRGERHGPVWPGAV